MTKNQKILLGVGILAVAGWYLYSKNKSAATSTTDKSAATGTSTPAASATAAAAAAPSASFVGVSKAQEAKFANASGKDLTLSKIGLGK